jgi:nucleotide-binding universal stress UspA family protein
MNETIRMLLYSDGSQTCRQALALGKHIGVAMADSIDILAIARTADGQDVTTEEAKAAAAELRAAGIPVTVYQRPGLVTRRLIGQASARDYDIVVIGSRGRRGIRRLIAGSRACTVLGRLTTSVLVVKGEEHEEINDILLCSEAGPTSRATVEFAAKLARSLNAHVTLLHVMSQVSLTRDARAADLEAEAEALMAGHCREGIHLEEMLELLSAEGVQAKPLVRHGLVVDEIIAEAQYGRYDMLVIGAHATPGIEGLLSSDLAKQIMLSANRPVLIIRQDH